MQITHISPTRKTQLQSGYSDTETEHERQFAVQFARHVGPQLRAKIAVSAIELLTADADHGPSYAGVYYGVWWHGWRRGASFLTPRQLAILSDWIHDQIWRAIDRLSSQVEVWRLASGRAWREAVRWDAVVEEACHAE